MTSTRILLIRHGQSEWNASGRWQGQADPPLTDLGREQATKAAPNLPDDIDILASSTLVRASETADIFARALAMPEPHREALLMERSAGEFEGLTREGIEEQFPGYLASGRWPDGWEDDAALRIRIHRGLVAVAETFAGATIAAVCHGGVIRMLIESAERECAPIPNLCALWLEVSEEGEVVVGDRHELLPESDRTVPGQI